MKSSYLISLVSMDIHSMVTQMIAQKDVFTFSHH
jgi:hypothetical protein